MDTHHSRTEEVTTLDEGMEAPPLVRFDERRMHIRAYNYWASLLGNRSLPSIEDLNPEEIEDFGSHSVLLDFTSSVDNPSIAYLGRALATQCDIDMSIRSAAQIPPRTLLSRLTDHYLQIIANAAPIGFEAEFTNQRGIEIMYRGIMMPFSSDDDTIDFVYGVINWKEVATHDLSQSILAEVEAATPPPAILQKTTEMWADGPASRDISDLSDIEISDIVPCDDAFDLTADMVLSPENDTLLGDTLARAREAAAIAHANEGRTRHALYRAVGLAHAFARIAAARPDDYAKLLSDAAIDVQPRSPLTALAKLVFGTEYDKTRLAEFVCAISFALEENMEPGALIDHLHASPGGLKGVVAHVRALRRGATANAAPRARVKSRQKLATARAVEPMQISTGDEGLAVVVVRREEDGSLTVVAALDEADQLSDRVYTKVAKTL